MKVRSRPLFYTMVWTWMAPLRALVWLLPRVELTVAITVHTNTGGEQRLSGTPAEVLRDLRAHLDKGTKNG